MQRGEYAQVGDAGGRQPERPMATTRKSFVLGALVAALVAAVCSLVALATEQWVTANPVLADTSVSDKDENSYSRYGLFKGFMRMNVGYPGSYEFYITCVFSENVCAHLCETSGDTRHDWLKNATSNDDVTVAGCRTLSSNSFYGETGITTVHKQLRRANTDRKYINAGIWLCTIIFLIISTLFGIVATGLACNNFFSNPVDWYMGITGIYICNAAAWCFTILVLCLWGIHYSVTLIHDVAIQFTITGDFTSDKMATLGYSYWINIVPLVMYPVSVCFLYLRDYLNAKDPGQKNIHLEESSDPVIYLY